MHTPEATRTKSDSGQLARPYANGQVRSQLNFARGQVDKVRREGGFWNAFKESFVMFAKNVIRTPWCLNQTRNTLNNINGNIQHV
mmetsp:Transcript_33312/g.56672  ORF Transcript_33312/g.56672 Transcript_33312/m.56672 type:complete len:85 (+) Transcript_33312:295-549(+)|eukprot:CAMPEP_0183747974 /NCGR_PEP_ID=MMETSP0737-20130205/67533_1 /TAXON_ID=385413 /ORGANISM="Thalassiosira miniscula, Strain CCMP1093" /LENGTH=84 /DNA_ID=CAMNT_0025983691 /DNA_START=875 /DNA_END=1129 /DNA_ORIENTATION=-